MEAVGYDLYCKMLNQAVLALKGEETEEESYATSVECDIDAYIPAAYIKNEYQKLDIYKRISAIETEDYVERKPKGITIEDMLFKAEEILKGLRKLRM